MKARSIARELALLGISQLADTSDEARQNKSRQSTRQGSGAGSNTATPETLSPNQLDALLVKALTALSADVGEALETADGELQRSERLMLESETRTIEADKVRSRVEPSVPLVETAINRVGGTLEFLVFAQQGDKPRIAKAKASLEESANHLQRADQLLTDTESRIADISEVREAVQSAIAAVKVAMADLRKGLEPGQLKQLIDRTDIRRYATDLLDNWINHWRTVDGQLNEAMEKWSIRRLARVDRDILRLAMMEIIYMDVPKRVAIDEAVEMAKRYSDEDSYRFINGVLRRTTDKLDAPEAAPPSELSEISSDALSTEESSKESEAPEVSLKPVENAPVESTPKEESPEKASTEISIEAPVVTDPGIEAPTAGEPPSLEVAIEEQSVLNVPEIETLALEKSPAEAPAEGQPSSEAAIAEPVLDEPIPKPRLQKRSQKRPLEESAIAETESAEHSSPESVDSGKTPEISTPKRSIPAPIKKNTPTPKGDNPWPAPE